MFLSKSQLAMRSEKVHHLMFVIAMAFAIARADGRRSTAAF
jgi:hypothetical protein